MEEEEEEEDLALKAGMTNWEEETYCKPHWFGGLKWSYTGSVTMTTWTKKQNKKHCSFTFFFKMYLYA